MQDDELVHARANVEESDWSSWPPAPIQSVDPAEVPELGTFFFTKRIALVRGSVVFLFGAIALLAGVARAVATESTLPAKKDSSAILVQSASSASATTPTSKPKSPPSSTTQRTHKLP